MFRSLVAVLASLALLLPAAAQANDPVLIEVGSHKERASAVLDRFEIAVRGLVMGQGGEFSRELLAQVYPFLPQYLEQRGAELALLQAARFIHDSRDQATEHRLERLDDAYRLFRCHGIMNCTQVCPKGLNPSKAIGDIRRTMIKRSV